MRRLTTTARSNVKNPLVGQAYGADGISATLHNPFTPTAEETRKYGILPQILPLPRFNRSQPGNVFRIFEKGGAMPLFLGSPTLDEPPGKPERRLSERGLGTLNRTDPGHPRRAKNAASRSVARLHGIE